MSHTAKMQPARTYWPHLTLPGPCPPAARSTRYSYPSGVKQAFQIFVVPIVPGTCRIFFQEGRGRPAGAPAPAPAALQAPPARAPAGAEGGGARPLAALPPALGFWDALKHVQSLAVMVLDQDVVIMSGQVRAGGFFSGRCTCTCVRPRCICACYHAKRASRPRTNDLNTRVTAARFEQMHASPGVI
jgi:hypothetical protein